MLFTNILKKIKRTFQKIYGAEKVKLQSTYTTLKNLISGFTH